MLKSIASPLRVKRNVVEGKRTSLDAFGVALAATVSLMFVGVLLAAGMLALEREENAFTRLVRGLVSRTALLAEKVLLARAVGRGRDARAARRDRDLPRPRRRAAAAVARGARGLRPGLRGAGGGDRRARARRPRRLAAGLHGHAADRGARARAGRARSPTALYDAIRAISAVFPFRPALQAVDGALNDTDPGVWQACAHLAALVAGYGVLARLALRRFG